MADRFFQEVVEKRMVWVERKSAFCRYKDRPIIEKTNLDLRLRSSEGCGGANMNKKMIELWKRNWSVAGIAREPERQRCYRHMISERMRREKQKRNYSALHNLLPPGTKSDKNSVIQAAALEIQRLQGYGEELRSRGSELESKLAARVEEEKRGGELKVTVRVPNPTSGIDSILQVLKCLKSLGVTTRAIQSGFSGLEFSVALEMVETERTMKEKEEVEKAVRRTLLEASRQLP